MTHCLERTFQPAHLLLAPSYRAVCELGHLDSYQLPTHKREGLGEEWTSSIHERSQPLTEEGNWQNHCQRKQLGRLQWVIRLLSLLSGQSSGSLKYLPATVDWDRLIPASKWGGVRCMRWQRVRNKSWTKYTHCGIVKIMKMLQEKEKGGEDNLVWFINVNSLGKKSPKNGIIIIETTYIVPCLFCSSQSQTSSKWTSGWCNYSYDCKAWWHTPVMEALCKLSQDDFIAWSIRQTVTKALEAGFTKFQNNKRKKMSKDCHLAQTRTQIWDYLTCFPVLPLWVAVSRHLLRLSAAFRWETNLWHSPNGFHTRVLKGNQGEETKTVNTECHPLHKTSYLLLLIY